MSPEIVTSSKADIIAAIVTRISGEIFGDYLTGQKIDRADRRRRLDNISPLAIFEYKTPKIYL